MGLADFAGAKFPRRCPTGPVSIFLSKQGESHETGHLFRMNSPSFDFFIETGPGHPFEFEPENAANPTRFLSKIDQ